MRKSGTKIMLGLGILSLYIGAFAVPTLNPAMSVNEKDGTISIGEMKILVVHFAPGWKCTPQNKKSIRLEPGSGKGIFRGRFIVSNGSFDFYEKLTPNAKNGVDFQCVLNSSNGIPTQQLSLMIEMPFANYNGNSLFINGKKHLLGEGQERITRIPLKPFNITEIPCKGGKIIISGISDKLRGTFYDYRESKYHMRLLFSPVAKEVKNASIRLNFEFQPLDTAPVDISPGANTGFTDEVADNRKGFFTEGEDSKLTTLFKPGDAVFNGVKFKTLSPRENNGKTCIVLRGGKRQHYPESVKIPVSSNEKYIKLYLLHATVWAGSAKDKVGVVKATYADGSISSSYVIAGRDVTDWTNGGYGPNYNVAWTGENPRFGRVNLYMSSFSLKDKPLKQLEFISSGKMVWNIRGVSVSNDDLYPVYDKVRIVLYRANDEWRPIKNNNYIIPGSALDFSFLLDAPAGKYGSVKCVGGQFRFAGAPDKTLRFYGTNLCKDSNFPSRAQAEKIADFIAACGYNAVRFFGFDRAIVHPQSTMLNKEELDKFEYLIYCLKRKGIYYTLDLHSWRQFKKGEFKEVNRDFFYEIKLLLPVVPKAMKNMKEFAKNLLSHVNPHTGMALKDDPALISISLLNENTLFLYLKMFPDMEKLYRQKFAEYLKAQKLAPSLQKDNKRYYRYVLDLQIKSYEELKQYLRGIGVNVPFTNLNFGISSGLAIPRNLLDYVDNHIYWDGARYLSNRWSREYYQNHRSLISSGLNTLFRYAVTRILGKPFMITEFNCPFPNPFRAEMAPIMGSFAALQGWNGIFRYSIAHRLEEMFSPARTDQYSIANEPMVQLSERIGSMFFSGLTVKPLAKSVPFVITPKYIYSLLDADGGTFNFVGDYYVFGLCAKIGSILFNKETDQLKQYPFLVVPNAMKIPNHLKRYRLITDSAARLQLPGKDNESADQVRLDTKHKTYTVVTPQAESISFCGVPNKLRGDVLTINGKNAVGTCFIGAIDGKPLQESKRILALYLTNTVNTGLTIEYRDVATVRNPGKLPYLARQGLISFRLKLKRKILPKIWALSPDGSRNKKITPCAEADGFSFDAKAVMAENTFFAYEMVW